MVPLRLRELVSQRKSRFFSLDAGRNERSVERGCLRRPDRPQVMNRVCRLERSGMGKTKWNERC